MRVRYDTRDENGDTRRERNEKFNQSHKTPDFEIPDHGFYLWEWYFDLSERLRRVRDGVAERIPPTEYLAWAAMTGEIVYPWEYAILADMDVAFCDEMDKELADYRTRVEDQAKRGK